MTRTPPSTGTVNSIASQRTGEPASIHNVDYSDVAFMGSWKARAETAQTLPADHESLKKNMPPIGTKTTQVKWPHATRLRR